MSLWASIPASPSLGMGGSRARPGNPLSAHCCPCALCSEPIVAPLLRPPHAVPQGGRAPRACLSLAAPACRALCRVPGPGTVPASFGREKSTRNLLHQCWVLPNPQHEAGCGELAQWHEAGQGKCPQPGHLSRALWMAAASPHQVPRQHPAGRMAPTVGVSPCVLPCSGAEAGVRCHGTPRAGRSECSTPGSPSSLTLGRAGQPMGALSPAGQTDGRSLPRRRKRGGG